MAGRKTKLTPDRAERIIGAIRLGGTLKMAAAQGGVGEATLKEWLARGQGTDPDRPSSALYADFANAVTRAAEEGDLALVGYIRSAAPQDWRAAAHLLAVRHPAEWSVRHKLEHAGDGGGAVKVQSVVGDDRPAREVVTEKVIEAAERFRRAAAQ